jgi:uncharacterized protein YcsI (UPF0317 family)
MVLRGQDAADFAAWCEANPAVAPVIERTHNGQPGLPTLGADIDLRHDLPAYQIFEHGALAATVDDIADAWHPDCTGFAFGCSFSLEEALREGGIALHYEARGFGGAIYLTGRETVAVGRFAGPLVVSMRPIPARQVEATLALCARYPLLHGAPVHVGDPAALGLCLEQPLQSLGDVSIAEDEVPVFWACGVTTQYLLAQARPAWAASHVSARMLVTDLPIVALLQG